MGQLAQLPDDRGDSGRARIRIDRASKQLGHSGVAVTERHYIERAKVAPDNRGALDQLAR
ncbi:hypothetical protein [Tsukamurella strandjordii]|uniref:Uncharacterized protein n=1 Tax=Tsukamurella strandjordii TaxID=147577 RepID=A0AA90NS34_9ACTN|nr:hypothetical protein [Tsukamurella strandjordii]MDP0399784.1 hypothetical protein [Tsukamurella strandjordii]